MGCPFLMKGETMATYNGQMQDSSSNILLPTPHSMATIETGTTASQAYAIGDSLVYNNQLCKVTKAIASGDALTIGTNIAYNNVGAISKQLVASDGTEFYFDVLNGDYGYYPSAAKVASEFVKFGGSQVKIQTVIGYPRFVFSNLSKVSGITSIGGVQYGFNISGNFYTSLSISGNVVTLSYSGNPNPGYGDLSMTAFEILD